MLITPVYDVLRASCLVGTVVCLAPYLSAQSTKAELFGLVRDPSRLPVRAAIVELTNVGTGLKSSCSTGEDGAYQFLASPAGDYQLSVSKAGFAVLKRDGINLRVGDRLELALDLTLGDASQIVEVTAAVPLLQFNRGTVSFVVEQKKLVAVPLDGRNFVPLIALSPGVNLPPRQSFPSNQWQPTTGERIHLRRHQRPSARTRAGGLLPRN